MISMTFISSSQELVYPRADFACLLGDGYIYLREGQVAEERQ